MTPETTKIVSLLIFSLAAILLAGCSTVKMQSQWNAQLAPSTFDTEKPHKTSYFDDASKIRVSIMNNDATLYIQLVTRSQTSKMLLLRTGFTTWIDSSGKSTKNFGLLFPLAQPKKTQASAADHVPRNNLEEMVQDGRYTLAILDGLTDSRQTISISKAVDQGIIAKISLKHNYLIYDLQLPLNRLENSNSISIGFESGKLERPAGQKASRGQGKGGGKGGGKGQMMGGKGGKRGSHGGDRPQPIELWVKVQLAEGATQ